MAPGIQKKAMFKHIRQVDISLLFIYPLLYFFFLKRDMKSMILSSFVALGIEPRNWHAGGKWVTRNLYPQLWALVFQIAFPARTGKGTHCDSKKQFCFCLTHAGLILITLLQEIENLCVLRTHTTLRYISPCHLFIYLYFFQDRVSL